MRSDRPSVLHWHPGPVQDRHQRVLPFCRRHLPRGGRPVLSGKSESVGIPLKIRILTTGAISGVLPR